MTKASFKVVIDDREVQKLFKDLDTVLPRKVADATFNAGNKAKMIAKDFVPVGTGLTRDGIISMIKINKKTGTEVIVGFVSNPHPNKVWRGGEFNLPAWMTYSNKALSHPWKSGHPRFLEISAKITSDMYGREVETATDYILGR